MIHGYLCTDRGDQMAVRRKFLLDHLRYIETIADKIFIAGPAPSGAPGVYKGSLILYKVDTADEAKALFDADPYAKADIWESVQPISFSPAVGDQVGGVTWKIVDGQVQMLAKPA